MRQQLGSMLESPSGQAAISVLRRVALSLTSTACPQGVDFQQWNSHWGSWREGYSRAIRDLESLPYHDPANKQEQEADLVPWGHIGGNNSI